MPANLYERSVTDSGGWVPLADASLVMDATLIASPLNTGNVTVQFTGMSGDPMLMMTAAWPPGATVHLRNVDLSKISINVPTGHTFLVVAQSP